MGNLCPAMTSSATLSRLRFGYLLIIHQINADFTLFIGLFIK